MTHQLGMNKNEVHPITVSNRELIGKLTLDRKIGNIK